MRYGINLPNYGPLGHRAELLAISNAAVELGYESVWVSDHILMPNSMPEPYGSIVESLSALAFLAGRTDRLLLGSSVIVLPQRDPILLAKQAVAVHELSDGRLVLGSVWDGSRANTNCSAHHGSGVSGSPTSTSRSCGPCGPNRIPVTMDPVSTFRTRCSRRAPDRTVPSRSWSAARAAPPSPGRRATRMAGRPSTAVPRTSGPLAGSSRLAPRKRLDVSLRIGVHVHGCVPRPVGSVIQGSPDEARRAVATYAGVGVDRLIVAFRVRELDQFLGQMEHFAREVLSSPQQMPG